MCVSDNKIDVVVICVSGIRDSVICLRMYACGEVESNGQVDWRLGKVTVFNYGCDVEVVTSCFLQHYCGCGVESATLWYCESESVASVVVYDISFALCLLCCYGTKVTH